MPWPRFLGTPVILLSLYTFLGAKYHDQSISNFYGDLGSCRHRQNH